MLASLCKVSSIIEQKGDSFFSFSFSQNLTGEKKIAKEQEWGGVEDKGGIKTHM